MHKKIFLAGFRATGKTTVGKLLAEELGCDFVDMDAEIVKSEGKSIAEITDGGKSWKRFRETEHDVLTDLLKRDEVVVATGGGAFVNDLFGKSNTESVQADKDAKIVLLTCDDDVIRERILQDESGSEVVRPILNETRAKELGEVKVEEIVKDSMEILKVRKPLYDKLTDVVVDTCKMDGAEAVKEILKYL